MIAFYPQIKLIHIVAVLASGGLFLIRGLALNLGAQWVMAPPLKCLSYAIDTVLLTAALMLATILHQYPFVHSWLTAKVLLLVVYIVVGSIALKRARTARARWAAYVAALLIYAYVISVARTHHPLGMLTLL